MNRQQSLRLPYLADPLATGILAANIFWMVTRPVQWLGAICCIFNSASVDWQAVSGPL